MARSRLSSFQMGNYCGSPWGSEPWGGREAWLPVSLWRTVVTDPVTPAYTVNKQGTNSATGGHPGFSVKMPNKATINSYLF